MARIKVAFQGEHGAYSELAAHEHFSQVRQQSIVTVPCREFRQVFAAVLNGDVQYGLVPLENSLAGSIHENYDHLLQHEVWIQGEHSLRVEHNLIGLPGSKPNKIRRILSHPQALAQCAATLSQYRLAERCPVFDTAGSVKMVIEAGDPTQAAIASSLAAKVHGGEILRRHIEDNKNNYTRFAVIGKKPRRSNIQGAARTSIVYGLKSIPGALFKSLSVFATRDIDLLKIESRPLAGSPWNYLFYLDFAADSEGAVGANALRHLAEISEFVRVLGTYPMSCQPERSGAKKDRSASSQARSLSKIRR